MRRFFTSDHHFGHRNIINFANRPFRDAEHMNVELVNLWNEVVDPDDEVWYLGDLAMGDRYNCVPWAGKLNGIKFFLPGNHDYIWQGASRFKREKHSQLYRSYFAGIFDGPTTIKLANGQTVVMNHFPGRGENDQYDRRFSPWEYDGDLWVLHGHTHSPIRVNKPKKLIHVGVDAWDYRPVSEDAIIQLIEN